MHKASFCEEDILHELSKSMHNKNNYHFKIEEHMRKVASLLAQSMTEIGIAEQLEYIHHRFCIVFCKEPHKLRLEL